MSFLSEIEIVPAILSKTKQDLMQKISRVSSAPILQIDLMDGIFVNNKTIGLESLKSLPKNKIIEYHLMVSDPLEWIQKLPGGEKSIFQIHVESGERADLEEAAELVRQKESGLCWVLNPPTQVSMLEGLEPAQEILVMTVYPGLSGQKYICEMEDKISELRSMDKNMIIEVDGGITEQTALRAVRAGANRLAAASTLFEKDDADLAYKELKTIVNKQ